MHDLQSLILERVTSGLKRKSVTKPSKWAETYRVIKGRPWRFDRHPWQREMHDSDAEINVGQKSAQMGYTDTVLNITFFNIDVNGVDCLYVLPSKTPDAGDFSASRFDPALEESTHLSKMFSNVKNVGHKRAGSSNLYIRGSQSRSGLKSIPVGFVVMDEIEEFNKDSIPLALERTSGQIEKQVWMISTPTIENSGINLYYNKSTKEHFFFKCPKCSRRTELIFPDCLEITADDANDPSIHDSFIKCKECQNKLEHQKKYEWLSTGIWVPEYVGRDIRGFYINQLYSSSVKPVDFAKAFFNAQINPADETELYNSKLGLTHIIEGAKITDSMIDDARKSHKNDDHPVEGIITMGIDVGKWLHYEIDLWIIPKERYTNNLNLEAICKVINYGKVQHFDELDKLMMKYKVLSCVIDANPERRKAFEFATRFYGLVKMCFYGRGIQGKQIHIGKDNSEPTITVDRTSWLDLSLGRFRNSTIKLPMDVTDEYRRNIKSLVRIYEKDVDGNPVGRYKKNDVDEDHYAHARNYSEIALPFALSRGKVENIGNIL